MRGANPSCSAAASFFTPHWEITPTGKRLCLLWYYFIIFMLLKLQLGSDISSHPFLEDRFLLQPDKFSICQLFIIIFFNIQYQGSYSWRIVTWYLGFSIYFFLLPFIPANGFFWLFAPFSLQRTVILVTNCHKIFLLFKIFYPSAKASEILFLSPVPFAGGFRYVTFCHRIL